MVNDAGGGNDFVGGVAFEIKLRALATDSQVQGPDVNSRQHKSEIG